MQSTAPADPEQFCILVQAMVGPAAGPGEESFDFTVCSVKWMERAVLDAGFVFGRNFLVVEKYDYQVIFNAVESLCRRISGSSWRGVAEQLGRYGRWEFEDYRES